MKDERAVLSHKGRKTSSGPQNSNSNKYGHVALLLRLKRQTGSHLQHQTGLLATKGWLRSWEETCTETDADQEPWFWSCDVAYEEKGTEPTADLEGAPHPPGHWGVSSKSAFRTAGSGLLRAEPWTSLHVCLRTCCYLQLPQPSRHMCNEEGDNEGSCWSSVI